MTRPRRDGSGGQGDALEHLDPVALAVAISKLPPNHALVAAARTGAEIADARWEHREAQRQASKDVAGAILARERGWADRRVPHAELVRRRAEVPEQRRPADVELDAACREARAAADEVTRRPDDDDDATDDDEEAVDRDELVDER